MELIYMDNIKNDEYFIQNILKNLRFIVEHMEHVNRYELEQNEVL